MCSSDSKLLVLYMLTLCVSTPHSAGCFFGGEVRLQSQASVLSDADPETERAGGEVVPTLEIGDAPKPRIPKVTSDSFISELVSDREGQISCRDIPPAGPSIPEEDHPEKEVEDRASPAQVLSPSQSGEVDPQWSNVDLEEAQMHLTSGPGGDAAETSSLSSVATYNLALEEPYGPDEHPKWAWVSGGGCLVECHTQLNWFNSSTSTGQSGTMLGCMMYCNKIDIAMWRSAIVKI